LGGRAAVKFSAAGGFQRIFAAAVILTVQAVLPGKLDGALVTAAFLEVGKEIRDAVFFPERAADGV
jgi:hypothetical protein